MDLATDIGKHPTHPRGFTLIELLVTLTILGLIATLAAPVFSDIIISNRATTATNSLVSDLYLARSQAIKGAQTVTVCKYSTTEGGVTACDPDASWQDGWIIFTDPDSDEELDDGETILKVQNALPTSANLHYNQLSSYIKFLSTGRTNNVNSSFSFCDQNNAVIRQVAIYKTGRVRTEKEPENFSRTYCD